MDIIELLNLLPPPSLFGLTTVGISQNLKAKQIFLNSKNEEINAQDN
jgi:hypothetical protein